MSRPVSSEIVVCPRCEQLALHIHFARSGVELGGACFYCGFKGYFLDAEQKLVPVMMQG